MIVMPTQGRGKSIANAPLQPKAAKGKSKPAATPYGTKKAAKKEVNPLFEKKSRTFGIGMSSITPLRRSLKMCSAQVWAVGDSGTSGYA
jgi:hypothetical protein